ncbi:MAG: beta-ketoacyl-ACP synthase II [Candidatus Omnitrophica bacterium]|nr:beta-ketoacyl-ACP synthase II [Candidatus Omnitrophota bacterium]MBU2266330.1 beta-ketoacyl-ACP synthase II [Candidatus Omnitrophota bacterium]MBU2473999.1 beta-ketoacyl-ACP synthase II [Candidatus Omnitrophota bacterium]
MRRVVVTGCGVVSSVGIGKDSFWESLVNGRSGIGAITRFDASAFDSRIAGEVKDFTPPDFLSIKDLRRTPRFVQFALKAAAEALAESGVSSENIDPYQIGVIIGSGVGSLETIEKEHKTLLEKGPSKLSPFMIPMLITNEAAGNVAIYFKLKGMNFCTVTACASGAHAIGEGFRAIRQGKTTAMVCGGTEACIVPLGVGGFCAVRGLSKRNNEPQRASRPFDRERDGFVIAEGAGMVVLEDFEHAKKRGAYIYAELAGYGATCDAYHITAPNPDGESAAKAISLAMEEAGVGVGGNIYINAHGTSTQLNDKMETKAIKTVFGSQAKDVAISSIKSMTGHTLGAAGAVEFITCCLALKNKLAPPTINYENPDPECDLDYIPNEARPFEGEVAFSNSLGFGGHNATLLIKKIK